MAMQPFVQWHLTGHGYHVAAYDGDCQPIKEYSAGDHPLDSQTVAVNDAPLPEETLVKFAEQTAHEMAAEMGIPRERVSRDTDSEDDLS